MIYFSNPCENVKAPHGLAPRSSLGTILGKQVTWIDRKEFSKLTIVRLGSVLVALRGIKVQPSNAAQRDAEQSRKSV